MVRSFRSPIVTLLLLAVLLPTLSGCGVIFGGTREIITATSAPDGARITASPSVGNFTTPASMSLERKHSYTLTFTKDGYEPATFQINNSIRGGIVVLDVLFTGLIGVVVDAVTGGWYKLEPKSAVVALTRTDGFTNGPETIEINISVGPSEDGKNKVNIDTATPGVLMRLEQN